MKMPKFIGLAAAAALVALAPGAALAQKKPAAGEIPAAARKAGMEDAPAIVQAASLSCQVSDARLIGGNRKGGPAYYEIACGKGQMGFVLQTQKGNAAPPTAFSCLVANTPPAPDKPPSAPCLLPDNANPEALLTPMLTKAGVSCVPTTVRSIGQTSTETFMEIACQGGTGYIGIGSAPFDVAKPLRAQNCLMYDDNANAQIKCILSDKAQRLAVVDTYAKAANNGCVVKDRRFVGMMKDNSQYYEASCEGGKGYLYKVAADGSLAQTLECAKSQGLTCELSDSRQAQTEQAALYTKLAKSAGSTCDVDKYALFPAKPGEEAVELTCKDGSSAVGVFKVGKPGAVYNCAYSLIAGYRCSPGKTEAAYALLTADLKKLGKDSCAVSNMRPVGRDDKGAMLAEVACADGLKGYIVEYKAEPKMEAVNATGCALAGGCKLPGNT